MVFCPFDISHRGTASDGIDLYKKRLTLACEVGDTADGGADDAVMQSLNDENDGDTKPRGCTIRGAARHFNILADSVAIVGITFANSQHSAISVGEYVYGAMISNCVFRNNIRVAGDGGAVALGRYSEDTLVVGCEFNRNAAWGGGALSGVGSAVEVRGCLFRGNRASIGVGGAIKLVDEDYDRNRVLSLDAGGDSEQKQQQHDRVLEGTENAPSRKLGRYGQRNRTEKRHERKLNKYESTVAASTLILSDSRFMSNSAAVAGPAIYQEYNTGGTKIYIRTRADSNYGCANLALSTSTMCNGFTDGTACFEFDNTCDGTVLLPDEEAGGGDGGSSETPQQAGNSGAEDDADDAAEPNDGGADNVSTGDAESKGDATPDDSVPAGGTTGISDDLGPEQEFRDGGIVEPTGSPTIEVRATASPTSAQPSSSPTTAQPSSFPTTHSTEEPTTAEPTSLPTFVPTSFPTYAPTAEPTIQCNMDEVERHSAILAQLEAISDATDLRRTTTPQGKAVDWLVFEDPSYLCADDIHLIQRYVLAVIYYSTGGDETWLTCSKTEDIANTCVIGERYLSNYHECVWSGIGCNADNFVTKIAFEENGLSGTIPTEIGALHTLKTIRMERGQLSGPIPETIGALTNLEKLDMDYNKLWGTLPSSLQHLSKLELIDLNHNELSGSIDVLSGLSNLFFIQLQSNFFSGTVPESSGSIDVLSGLSNLFFIQLQSNFFSGNVPEALGSLQKLQVFAIHDNQLSGNIALGFCALRIEGQLEYLEADCSSPADGGTVCPADGGTVTCVCCTTCYPNDGSSTNRDDGNYGDDLGNPSVPDPPTDAPSTASPSSSPTASPSKQPTPNPTAEPTYAPSPFTSPPTAMCGGISKSARREAIANTLAGAGVSTRGNLLTTGSPQAQALWWILNKDPTQMCPGDERLAQRYLAALFYYSTNGQNWVEKGTGNQEFLGSAGECLWMGITCNRDGEITHIEFENNGLSGSIPYEIGSFTKLEILSLEKGEIGGRIPHEIGNLQELRELDLDFNKLTGALPETLGDAPKLGVVDLNSNMLSGNITPLAGVRGAYFIQLHNNLLTGTIPPAIGLLGGLQVLTIHKNNIEGGMPIMVCNRRSAFGGSINHLWADCAGADPKVTCSCCTKCFE
eukprot:CAMPEP_0178536250 /NCGR_PEP_ID=MMETSP0696-20121128/35978_1 /TAXON_ID=265572 /ORGANISM="Extubocellulus spinifer, Strain CCMP396" /LENGTH=1142 /DNA_ID=CAMNT_0020168443 /DNA_START=316 /DNA_END=3745 /DNA_ORIENTATION=-